MGIMQLKRTPGFACTETRRSVKDEVENLLPQIIVGGPVFERILRAIFVEHTLEDRHVAGSHVDDLEADVVCVRVHVVMVTPFAAGDK